MTRARRGAAVFSVLRFMELSFKSALLHSNSKQDHSLDEADGILRPDDLGRNAVVNSVGDEQPLVVVSRRVLRAARRGGRIRGAALRRQVGQSRDRAQAVDQVVDLV